MANISDFERLSAERYNIEQEIRQIFRQLVKNHDVIEFDEEELPRILIRNEWDFERGGDYYDILRLESCGDGSVGIVTEGEYEVFFDGDIDTTAIEFLMREALEAVKEDE